MTSPAPIVRIGRDLRLVDLYVEHRAVSRVHATLTLGPDSEVLLTDAGSSRGVFVNGERLPPHRPTEVRLGVPITLGNAVTFELQEWHVDLLHNTTPGQRAPRPLVVTSSPTAVDPLRATQALQPGSDAGRRTFADISLAGAIPRTPPKEQAVPSEAPLDEPASPSQPTPTTSSVSLGYATSNDIVATTPTVSGRHARIYVQDGRYTIEDQGSTNGTWVDGARVTRAILAPGSVISLGSHRVLFDDDLRARIDAKIAAAAERSDVGLAPGTVIRVGRAPDNDVAIEASTVANAHATLTVLPSGDGYVVVPLLDGAPVFLNSRSNRVETRATVYVEDIIFLGGYRLPVARIPALLRREADAAEGQRVFVVGRDKEADITIDAPTVSRQHARIEVLDDGRFRIRDLGSFNGTYLNGANVTGDVVATTGDRLSLGSHEVRLDPVVGLVRRAYEGDIMVQAERISVEVPAPQHPDKKKRILNDISFTVYPTEFVGLMGPSGAGKTTLMMALAGTLPPSYGRSLLNGLDVYESYNAFRGNIGYVPQDDIIFPQLTVYESLYYTARLRLPADTTDEEIDVKIRDVLEQLEITHTADTRIGDALDKGISGGERKRVNLAQELITSPSLLFLDEPTSGLASEDTINVMRLLRGLSDAGKTILLTIHQPSLEAYRLMDNVIYMYRGNLVYYGPAYPDSILYFNGAVPAGTERDKLLADPGSAMRPLAEAQREALAGPPEEVEGRLQDVVSARRRGFETSFYNQKYVRDRHEDRAEVEVSRGGNQKTSRRGWTRQLRVLASRTARIKTRDRANTAILLAQAPVIATILAMVFSRGGDDYFEAISRGPAALFLLVASAIWFGCSNAARDIVSERAVYERERMVNLMIRAYTLSKVAVLGVVCAIQCALLLAIAYVPLGLQGSPLAMFGTLWLTSLVGLGMGLTLSALVRSPQAAMALVPIILIPQIILGGVIMPLHEMGTPTRALADLTASRWGFEAMLHVEYSDDDTEHIAEACGIKECVWGAGATGGTFTYYSGDPDDVTEAADNAGIAALVGGQVPYLAPKQHPTCEAFCLALREADPITPIDRSFGADPRDPLRVQTVQDIGIDGHAADQVTLPSPSPRTSLLASLLGLSTYFVFYLVLVMALLRFRDVEVD